MTTSTIMNKLHNLRDTIDCDPSIDTHLIPEERQEAERRLRGSTDVHEQVQEEDLIGILSSKKKKKSKKNSSSSSVCGVGRRCQEVVLPLPGASLKMEEATTKKSGRCVDVEGGDDHPRRNRNAHRILQEASSPTEAPTTAAATTTTEGTATTFETTENADGATTTTTITTETTDSTIITSDTNTPAMASSETITTTTIPGEVVSPLDSTEEEEIVVDTILTEFTYLCNYGELVGYECTCDFNADLYTGSGFCTTPEECTTYSSICEVEVTDCVSTTYKIDLRDGVVGVWDSQLCLQYLSPYQQTICYDTTILESGVTLDEQCEISLDGERCDSCRVYKFRDNNCYEFDCSNTNPVVGSITSKGSAKTGNTCDFPAHTVSLYLDTYGCPSCSLCGEGRAMTSDSDANIVLFNTTYDCSYVAEVSMQGFFTPESCTYFSEAAQIPCGCTESLVETSVETTTAAAGTTTDTIKIDDGDKDSVLDVGDFIETGTSGNMIDIDLAPPLSDIVAAAACSANVACVELSGDCCPTTSGEQLGCCDSIESTAAGDTDRETDTTFATTGVPTATPTSPPSVTSDNVVDDTQTPAPSVVLVPVVDTGAPSVTPVVVVVVVDTTTAPTVAPVTVAPVNNRDIITPSPTTPAPSAALVAPVVPEVLTTATPTTVPSTAAPVTVDTVSCSICFFEGGAVPNPEGMISIPGSSGTATSEVSCEEAAGLSTALGVDDELCAAIQREAAAPCCGIVVDTVPPTSTAPTTSSPTSAPPTFVPTTDTPTSAVTTVPPTVPEVVETEDPTQEEAAAAADDTSNYCTPCGEDKIMTASYYDEDVSVPTQGLFTCLELQQLGKEGTLDTNGICALVQSSSQVPCGCLNADGTPIVLSSSEDTATQTETDSTATTTNDNDPTTNTIEAAPVSRATTTTSLVVVIVMATTLSSSMVSFFL